MNGIKKDMIGSRWQGAELTSNDIEFLEKEDYKILHKHGAWDESGISYNQLDKAVDHFDTIEAYIKAIEKPYKTYFGFTKFTPEDIEWLKKYYTQRKNK